MIQSDFVPEASAVCTSPMQSENSSGTLPFSSLSKIPLPKCLVESPVGIGRPRNELRNRSLTGVEPSKIGICKPESQENVLSPLSSKPQPHALFTASKMREAEDDAVQIALTPINVNAFSAIDGQDGASITGRSKRHNSSSEYQQFANPSTLCQSTSTSMTLIRSDSHGSVEDGESRELNTGQTLVWNNAIFRADRSNVEQSPCIESNSSIHCSPNSASAVSNGILCVSGALPSSFTYNAGVAGLSSRFILSRHGGETLSPEELTSICETSNTLAESPRLGSSEVLAGDSKFIRIPKNGSYQGTDADCTMHSFSDCNISDEKPRTGMVMMGLEDTPFDSSCINCRLHQDQARDFMSTKKNMFDASLLEEEDFDLVTVQSLSIADTDMGNSPVSQYREDLHTADTSSMSTRFEDTAEPDNLYVVHNCRDFNKYQSQLLAAFPHQARAQRMKESLEAQLEDDIQRDIEDEISKEILQLSQKLANVQARHGSQRMLNGSRPAVLSCPVTPVHTPRMRQRKAVVSCNKQDGIPVGDDGSRHKRGRAVAAKVFQGNANRTPESETTSEKLQQSKPGYGEVCAKALNAQVMTKMSLGRRCSSSNSDAATDRCAHCRDNGQQSALEDSSHHDEDSLTGTPSSGSIRSNVTDYTRNLLKARSLCVGVPSPQAFRANNWRFEWMKTLRSGETGQISSPSTNVTSKLQLKTSTPKKQVDEDAASESTIRRDCAEKEREALLAAMTELETEFKSFPAPSLACRTTAESAQNPSVQNKQGTRNVGRVVASRYANCSESRVDERPESSTSKDTCAGYGCLDRRTAVHLMKAGLTRGSTGKKLSPANAKSNFKKAEKHSEMLLRRKFVRIQQGSTVSGQPSLDTNNSHDLPGQTPHIWSRVKETFNTEYETFVDGLKVSDLKMTKNLQEQIPEKEVAVEISQGFPVQEGSVSAPRGSALRSKSKRQPIRNTYIRCIEVILEQPYANRLAKTASQSLSPTRTRISDSKQEDLSRELELGVLEGHLHKKLETAGSESLKMRSQPLRTVYKLLGKNRQEGNVQDMNSGPCDLQGWPSEVKFVILENVQETKLHHEEDRPLDMQTSAINGDSITFSEEGNSACASAIQNLETEVTVAVPSCAGEWKTKATAAEQPLSSSLRDQSWEERIDDLEKERLSMPKIRTETGNVIVGSPRDSGCVKRIAKRSRAIEYIDFENLSPNSLQGRSDDPFESSLSVASELIMSCEKTPQCPKTGRFATPYQRPLQSSRKGTPQPQTKVARRQWKLPQSVEHHDIQRRSGKSIGSCRKFNVGKTSIPHTDIESFDLESFLCLVKESEDRVQTARPHSATVR